MKPNNIFMKFFKFSNSFIKELIQEIKQDDIISVANDLTYKIFFSIFPFIIFLISIVGFLNLDEAYLIEQLFLILPDTIHAPITTFITEVVNLKNPNILSFSLILSMWSASWGFGTAMKSINKAYGERDTRNILIKILINIASVVVFAAIIIISFVMLIFGDNIINFLYVNFYVDESVISLFSYSRYVMAIIVMFSAVLVINKISISIKISWRSLMPGTFITVTLWIAVSTGFNIYIKNFTRYSNVYGSLAGIIIFLLWLNILCIALLLGSEINAVKSKISLNDF